MTNEEQTRPVPVAIIGIGCLFPKADNVESYWANLQDGVDAIGAVPATHWRPEDYFDKDPKRPDFTYAARGGFLSPVDFPALELGISPNVLEATDSTQLLGLLAAKQALEVAGYGTAGKAFDRNKVSVILGVTGTLELVIPLGARLGHPHWKRALKEAGVEDSVAADVVQRIADSYVGWQEDSFPGLLGNVVAGRIANRLDLGGTNCVVDAACASSLSAMHLALLELAAGRSDMAIAGGMDTFNDIFMYMCFSKTPALSPTGDSRPFDTKADGTILGEGLGCVLLKRLTDAERDGDKIFAVIRSIGTSSDGKGQAIYAPAPKGQAKALRQAYRLAGVTPESIELVEAHGTGTRAGDAAEVTALNEVYRNGVNGDPIELPPAPWCAIGSVKSQIGHTKAAAGIAGLIKATLALYHKVLPPTIKVAQPIEQVSSRSPFYVNTEKRPWMLSRTGHPRRAAVSAFGFGGSNFHCVLEEHGSQKPVIDWDANVQILAFSAQLSEELRQRLLAWPVVPKQELGNEAWDDLRIEAARCRARFFGKHRYRLTIVVERGKKDVGQLIASAIAMLDKSLDQDAWTTPDGIYFSRRATPGKLALIFPGQGSQYVGMLRDLTCRWPVVQASLIEANAMFARHRASTDARLSDLIYPHSVFRDEDRQRNEDALRATDVAQPALGALSLGALRVLEHFHVQADAVAGHSYGELTALCAAGWIDAPALHMLSQVRGRLMAAGVGDRGGMLAVRAPLATVESVLREESLDLVLANRNAPNQAVLSGSSLEIERAREIFSQRKFDSRLLPVAAAFHSPFVADARKPFLDALEKVAIHPTATPVFANTTAQEYPRDPQAIRNLLAGQLAEPVRFVEEIENLYRSGVRTFIEVGPSNKLSGLIGAILEGRPHDVLTLDASTGKRPGFADLTRVLAPLAALGHRVDLGLWDEGQADKQTKSERKPTLTVPICGANYVKPKEARPAAPIASKPKVVAPASPAIVKPRQSTPVPRVQEARPVMAKPMNEPTPSAPADTGAMRQTLAMTQENLLALQKLAEQTAQLHRQFLEGQDRTLQVFQTLLEQQNSLLAGRPSGPSALPAPMPAPIVAKPKPQVAAPVVRVAPVVETPTPTPAPLPRPAAPAATNSHLQATLLDVVAAKTGYPAEMLQLDMELDTDLGIDSIKRVEIFALLQEKLPDAPPVKAEHLGTLRTLRQVVEFLGESLPSPSGRGAGGEGETAAPQSATPNTDEATAVFLDVVAQKTGYPPEMLQLDMELDTDLGIDSIKRVEIFALLQEKLPDAPTVKAEHLGTLRTLRHVIDFIAAPTQNNGTALAKPHDERSDSWGSAPERPLTPSPSPPEYRGRGEQIQRLIPTPLELDEQSPRDNVSLPANGEIWINGDDAELALAVSRRFELLGYRARVVSMNEAGKPTALAGLVILAPAQNVNDSFLQDAFRLLQTAATGLRTSAKSGGAVFATVSRMDGSFGLSGHSISDPLAGGFAGLSKTASHEWPDVSCKALDLASAWPDLDEAAFAIVEEILLAGPLEVGITPGGRCALQLQATPQDAVLPTVPLNKGDIVLVTGGARGVTAETAVALASAFAPTLVLLGRSPLPSAEPAWLAPLTQESDIKKALLSQMNGQATPKEVGERYQSVVANREILATLARLEQAGSRVIYRQVDVRDANAVRKIVGEIRQEIGPIKGLVHGAGVLADRRIEDKTREQFDMVYATKVASLQVLLDALEGDDLRVLALFSSSTARFGRTGQVDYAVANEVLNKVAHREAQRRPHCKVVSFNWGPWDGGMVNASLKKVFESEGVGTIPLQGGADFFVREICQPVDRPVEVVVLGALGETKSAPAIGAADVVAFEREIHLDSMPVLRSHVIKGHPVVPMALVVEWLARGALHANPGLAFHGFDRLQILKGVILHDDQPLHVRVLTGKAAKQESLYRIPLEMRSVANGREILHARAEIVLANKLPVAEAALREFVGSEYRRDKSDVYSDLLFHGSELQGIEQIETCSEEGIAAVVASAPMPSEWINRPMRGAWIADPLVLDCAFQLMIVWTQETHGAGSLPTSAGSYRQYQRAFPKDGVRILARVTKQSEHRALADIDFVDRAGKLIARMTDYECVIDPSLNQAFRGNHLGVTATPTL